MKLFSLIRGCRHGWPNHVKTSCTVCVIVLSLCSWTNIVCIKAFAGTTHSITFPLPTSHDFHFQRWDLRRRKFRSPGFKCVGGLGKTHRNHHWSENKDFSHPFLGILYNLVIWGKQTHVHIQMCETKQKKWRFFLEVFICKVNMYQNKRIYTIFLLNIFLHTWIHIYNCICCRCN